MDVHGLADAHNFVCGFAQQTELQGTRPWRKLVTSTKEKVHAFAQQTELQGTRTTESQTAPEDIKSLLQQLVAQETCKSMKSPGHHTSSQCHTRTRRTQHAAKTDPYKHILAQDSPDSMQATLCALQTAESHQTAPILAACCGHILDDLNTEGDAGLCGHCNAPYSQDNCASKQTEQWDRLWHRLAGCHGDEDQQSKLAVYIPRQPVGNCSNGREIQLTFTTNLPDHTKRRHRPRGGQRVRCCT